MTEYLVIVYTPSRQGILGPIPEKWEVETRAVNDLAMVISGYLIPPGGHAYFVPREYVIAVRSKTVNEVVDQGDGPGTELPGTSGVDASR